MRKTLNGVSKGELDWAGGCRKDGVWGTLAHLYPDRGSPYHTPRPRATHHELVLEDLGTVHFVVDQWQDRLHLPETDAG